MRQEQQRRYCIFRKILIKPDNIYTSLKETPPTWTFWILTGWVFYRIKASPNSKLTPPWGQFCSQSRSSTKINSASRVSASLLRLYVSIKGRLKWIRGFVRRSNGHRGELLEINELSRLSSSELSRFSVNSPFFAQISYEDKHQAIVSRLKDIKLKRNWRSTMRKSVWKRTENESINESLPVFAHIRVNRSSNPGQQTSKFPHSHWSRVSIHLKQHYAQNYLPLASIHTSEDPDIPRGAFRDSILLDVASKASTPWWNFRADPSNY